MFELDWTTFWADTLTASNFWPLVSAICALLTVPAVFFLPAISQCLRQRSVLEMVQKELSDIKLNMEAIVEHWESRSTLTDGSTGFKEVLAIEATAKRISYECWETLRFELNPVPYRCLKPFFSSASDVQTPDGVIAHNKNAGLDPFDIAEWRHNMASDFLSQLSKSAKLCKYLRIG